MRLAQWIWGTGFILGGVLMALGAFPGADAAATGPRIGLAMVFVTLGGLVIGVPLTTWILRRTTRPEDYEGTCPVGWACEPCGAFNYHPRQACRSCSGPRPADKQAS